MVHGLGHLTKVWTTSESISRSNLGRFSWLFFRMIAQNLLNRICVELLLSKTKEKDRMPISRFWGQRALPPHPG